MGAFRAVGARWPRTFAVDLDDPTAQVVVEVADRMQELFHEECEAWGQARPPCPGHQHPAKAELVEGAACWVCPNGGRIVAQIGRTSEPAG
jgi:hypothetical protein